MLSAKVRIEKLKKETSDLRKEVGDLKDTLMQQNELIIRLLSKQIQTEKIVQNKVSEFSMRFPLETFEDLNNFEMEINNENKKYFVKTVQNRFTTQSLSKNIVNVLSHDIIMNTNLDGHRYKRRLLNYPKTIDVLFLASRKDNSYTSEMFLVDLKRTLRAVKNRCHKINFRARQKLLSSDHQEQDKLPQQIAKKKLIVKTEETYFPPCFT